MKNHNAIIKRFWRMSLGALTLVLFFGSTESVAQSAHDPDDPAEVIDAFIEALGGEMSLVGIETLSLKAKYTGWTDAEGTFMFKDGKRLDLTTLSGTPGYDELHDGEKWIERSPSSPAAVLTEKEGIQGNEAVFDLPTDALRLRKQTDLMEIVAKEEFEDSDYAHCVCLRLKDDKDMNIHRYFNPDTGLLECVERLVDHEDGDGKRLRIRYFDFEYEEIEGLMFLKTARRTTGDDSFLDVVYSDFEIDKPIDDSLFEMDIDDD